MRLHRMTTVQAEEQYIFILKLFTNIINNNEYNNDFKKFAEFTTAYNKIQPSKRAKKCSLELREKLINRYGNTIPYDSSIVELSDNDTCNDYINASYLTKFADLDADSINKIFDYNVLPTILDTINIFNGKVIAAQGPTIDTKDNFLKMLKTETIGRIIMVTGLMESGKEKCFDYTSGENNLSSFIKSTDKKATKNIRGYNTEYGNYTEYILKNNDGKLVLTDGMKIPEELSENYVLEEEYVNLPSPKILLTKNHKNRYPPMPITPPPQRPIEQRKQLTLKNRGTLRINKSSKSNNARKKKDLIQRIDEFLKLKPKLSFCDCKIILLYIFVNKLLNNEIEDEYENIKGYIRQNYNNEENNTALFEYTKKLIITIMKTNAFIINKESEKKIQYIDTCARTLLKVYIYTHISAYEKLFDTVSNETEFKMIVNNICDIFDKAVELKKDKFIDDIDNPFEINYELNNA